ncbi:MAG: alpha/beta hydrolase [Actinobacteria bacterium]|nr:MAG: alpha/beta hydrolase [Actinomycetota bacterium]RIK06564.1 MAG: hypothetical protein DCC48_06525 [Acidobacteriota bacterium]
MLIATLVPAAACVGNQLDEASSDSPAATEDSAQADDPTSTDDPVSPGGNGFPSDWVPPTLNWAGCGAGSECASLTVPLDWDEPSGPTIDLALARRPATGDPIGPLLVNPGGPGGEGVAFVRDGYFNPAIESSFDIVGWDPRGVGESTALACGEQVTTFQALDSDPDDEGEQQSLDEAAKAVAEECEESDTDLLPHLGTDDVARDMEAIRLALGADALNYLGFSYGTSIGLQYAEFFPSSIRAMVLDGVVDPALDLEGWLAQQTEAMDAALARAFERCESDSTCPLDDAAGAFDEVAEMVETEPLPAGGRSLGPAEFAIAAISATYDPAMWPDLIEGLAEALEGDGSRLMELADTYYSFGAYTSYAAVVCVDSPHPVGAQEYQEFADRLAEISARVGAPTANELLPCAFWPVEPTGTPGEVVAEGSPPILVLGNTGDAATPYENSVNVAETLSEGFLVTYEGEGHTSYGKSTCVDEVVDDYLVTLALPPEDPDC